MGERRQPSLGGTSQSPSRSPLELRRLPPPLPPPPPGAAPQPPASAARTPRAAATLCRPLGPRPRPPRRARRRLRLRAVDAAATDADASSSAPPSFSLKANKHHGGGRRPPPTPASESPAHRRLANILASHWRILLGATISRQARGWIFVSFPPRRGAVSRPGALLPARPASLPALFAPSLLHAYCLLLFLTPFLTPFQLLPIPFSLTFISTFPLIFPPLHSLFFSLTCQSLGSTDKHSDF